MNVDKLHKDAQKKIQEEIRDKAVSEIENILRDLAAAKRVVKKFEAALKKKKADLVEELKEISDV